MNDIKKYDFTFAGYSLKVNDLIYGANQFTTGKTIDKIKLGAGNSATGLRKAREVLKRIKVLTSEQLNLLMNSDLDTQKHISFLAMCKVHDFIRDFVVDVIREKFLLYDYEISEGEFISFFRGKAVIHSNMDELTETSQNKIKQVTFKVLEQAGLIDNVKTKNIQPQLLDEQTIKTIIKDDPMWLKVFLFGDSDINNMTN